MMGSSSLFFFVAKSSSPSSERVEMKTKKAMKLSSHSTRSTRQNFGDLSLHRGEGKEERDNNDNRLKYDRARNKSEKYDKFQTYLAAGLIINRVISSFDVLSIMKKHNRIISFDLEEDSTNLKLKAIHSRS